MISVLRAWSIVLFAAVAVGLGSPASAAPPVPGGVDAVAQPVGEVSVHDLPEVAAEAADGHEKPHQVPDRETLNATKQSFGQSHQAPTPAPSAVATSTSSTITTASPGLVGLRRSESGGWIPPDTQIAVSGSYIFEAVNLEGRIWTKAGDLLKTFTLASLFGLSGSNLSDPKIRFDPSAGSGGRWFVAAITYNNSFTAGAWLLAVSKTSDPTGQFVVYQVSSSKSAPDFPALAVNADKVVLTANAFRGNSYSGTEFVVLNKAQLVAGVAAAYKYFGPPQGLFTIQPGHSLTACAITGCPIYMAAVAYNSASTAQLWRITGVPGVGSGVGVAIASGISIGTLTSPPDAKQLGTTTLIATNDNRLLEATYRGDALGGALWVAATSACVPGGDTATRACLRFIEFSISSGGTVTKPQDFDYGQSGFYYYFPAIQTDGSGNLIAVFSGSSSATYAGVYASGQKTTDAVNSFQVPALVKAGENSYTPFAQRWGDYSGAALDPASSSTVWVAGEYVYITGGSEWGTFIAPVQMGP